ncbi:MULTISPECIES: cob(I)yrinic acid a,c-diamide adenosyltransferase [unclassified Spiroplasma]|uniref:cob(I)yrinic acid a,c-diamide adenosyltransferase n=1 Tax=unclassified Spiroplasma TaxID=2637901 RepID=UPI00313BFE0A
MNQEQGYLHIYCGEGKGKTSILNGMTIRALGNDWNVVYFRFLKNRPTGELIFFEKHTNLTILDFYHSSKKFFWEMNDEEKQELKVETRKGLEVLVATLKNSNIDLIIVDEILGCLQNQLIYEDELVLALENKAKNIEVALSGRYCPEKLQSIADLISEVTPTRHYSEKSIWARKGIEY